MRQKLGRALLYVHFVNHILKDEHKCQIHNYQIAWLFFMIIVISGFQKKDL